jgi:hypothetical protein
MPRLRRLSLSIKRDRALIATSVSIGKHRLVYVLIADKRLKYPKGRSRIAYIGTTKHGLSRIARSVATRADKILSIPGVKSFDARIVICKKRKNVSTWKKLERALLIEFRSRHEKTPECNVHGKNMKETNEFRYFSRHAVRNALDEFS